MRDNMRSPDIASLMQDPTSSLRSRRALGDVDDVPVTANGYDDCVGLLSATLIGERREMKLAAIPLARPAVTRADGEPSQAELDRDMRKNPDYSVPVWQRNTNAP
jgi:hypothetical protein